MEELDADFPASCNLEAQARERSVDIAAPLAVAGRPALEIADVIQKRIADHIGNLSKVTAATIMCAKDIEDKQAKWNELNMMMKDNYAEVDDTVKLCVRGKVFETFKENLVREEGTYFHAMICSGAWKPNQDGAYFIDRKSEGFGRILDYLATGTISYEDLSDYECRVIAENIIHFQLKVADFAASDRWNGSRFGYIFKTGARGLGYYKDSFEQPKATFTPATVKFAYDHKCDLMAGHSVAQIADNIKVQMRGEIVEHSEDLAAFEAALGEIVKCASEIEAKLAKWAELSALMGASCAAAEDTVKLSVRGMIFETYRDNLVREKGTYFHGLTNGAWKHNKDGAFFIDRRPEGFDRILDYLATGTISYEDLTQYERDVIAENLDYFQLKGPMCVPCGCGPCCSESVYHSIDDAFVLCQFFKATATGHEYYSGSHNCTTICRKRRLHLKK